MIDNILHAVGIYPAVSLSDCILNKTGVLNGTDFPDFRGGYIRLAAATGGSDSFLFYLDGWGIGRVSLVTVSDERVGICQSGDESH